MVSPRLSRRRLLGVVAGCCLPLAGCRGREEDRQTPTPMADPPEEDGSVSDHSVGLSLVGEGFTTPVGFEVTTARRQYVVDQTGVIYLLTDGEKSVFLDLTDRIPEISGDDERGLLGLAFHPEFGTNGRFFVRYSAPPGEETPSGYSHRSILAEFQAHADGTGVDPDTERRLLSVPQPQPNNNGGDIVFGPDGYLYVALGDGGGAGDTGPGHASDWYDPVDGGNGQDVTSNLLGSILRIDVDGEKPYESPASNPLVGRNGLDEHYAWGFRDPRGMSFGPDGTLYVADSGQNRFEEVNVVVRGGNYGWNVREGTHCFRSDSCPREAADETPLTPPVVEYEHDAEGVGGVSVVGGYIYDGSDLGSFGDLYLFADWRAEGKLFVATPTEKGLWKTSTVSITDDVEPYVFAFGRDPDGELYLCTNDSGRVGGSSGSVYRLVPA